ncbi:hypothetical protein BDQ17DRAFT_1241618 [Cyathus striatus]|nr:hypothetical protein BDQ17DRAFT_1241618 [Cyathus striatus]
MLRPLVRSLPLRSLATKQYRYRSLSLLAASKSPGTNKLSFPPTPLAPPNYASTPCRRTILLNGPFSGIGAISHFHSTPRNEGGPLIPLFAAMLKASTAFEVARMASRVALTFMPMVLFKNHKVQRKLKHAAYHGVPHSAETIKTSLKRIRIGKTVMSLIILVPCVLFWATIIASLERTPLTGRWRMILLSPEEEDDIANQLAGPGWYSAVGDILEEDGPPTFIPPTDWRYQWVASTMRKLEASIHVLAQEPETEWVEKNADGRPMPPPTEYPLRPRPRASEYLRWFCESLCQKEVQLNNHHIPGPPYSLLLVDRPDASNAFSYGFGANGAGGIVVYSGFLDDIFAKMPPVYQTPELKPWWQRLLFGSTPEPFHPAPTPEQTSELAILLAHELSHLVLCHHLESLTSSSIIIPGTLSLVSDIFRVLIFPFTMFFGPFVNDAVAQMGKVGSGELIRIGEYCTGVKQEVEADVVSARLLAHAGFDARDTVTFWEQRSGQAAECSTPKAEIRPSGVTTRFHQVMSIMGASHPVNEVRIESLRDELARWERERRSALSRIPPDTNSSS